MSDNNDIDLMNMSDEDFLNANHNEFVGSDDENNVEGSVDPSDVSEEEFESSDESVDEDSDEEDTDLSTEEVDDEETASDEEEEESTDESDEEASKPLYSFKANGTEIDVKDEDEAVKLMQMGANYYEKMKDLKPHRKTLKTLEMNKITEDDINLMVELKQGNKDAISKLVREHGVNVHELDTDEDSTYTPSNHTVSDTEVELDEVLSSIQGSSSFSDTMNVVNKQWDEASKRSLVASPQLIANLNEHIANGTYAKVDAEVKRQRMFGGLANVSDLDAYNQVGQAMAQQGMFNAPAQQTTEVKAKPKGKAVDSERQDKKRKASPPKRTQKASPKKITSFMDMSDEEFIEKFG